MSTMLATTGRSLVLPAHSFSGAGSAGASGSHSATANLRAHALGHHDSLLELGLSITSHRAATPGRWSAHRRSRHLIRDEAPWE